MLKIVLRTSTAVIAFALCGLGSVALRAQDPTPQDPKPAVQDPAATTPAAKPSAQDAAAAKISGAWQLNTELSTDPASIDAASQQATRGTGASGRSSSGGGGGGGRRGGGRGGGGFGGGGGGSTMSADQLAQFQAMMSEIKNLPARMTIHATATDVTLTLDDGSIRKYTVNNKKEQIAIGSAQIDTTTKWDGDTLNIQMAVGNAKLVETYALTSDSAHLLISITPKLSAPGQQVTTKHVYDHIQ